MSANESLTLKEQHWGPYYVDDHGRYPHPPLPIINCPDRYHHGHPAAANNFPPMQYNLPLSKMDDGPSPAAGFYNFDQYLFSGLSYNLKAIPEGGSSSLTKGLSTHPPSTPPHYFNDLSLPMGAQSSQALPSSSVNDHHESSCILPQSPHLDQSAQIYPQESPNIPEIGTITDATLESSPLSNFEVFPISECHVCHEAKGAHNSELVQAGVSAIQELPLDFSAAPALVDEGKIYSTTPSQVLSGYVDSFAEFSTNGHGSPLRYSAHQNEGAALPNVQSAVQTSHPAIVEPSTTTNQGAAVNDNRSKFWCRRRGCGASFVQRQGLNRHEKDKHNPRNICPFCTSFEWRPGRKYLFLKHLEQHHPEQDPEAALALAQLLATVALKDK